jgi:hypothetical protein
MTIEPIGLIVFLIGIIGLVRPPAFLVYTFLGSTLLGAAAATNVSSIGGVSIQPAHLLFGFLTVRLLSSPEIRQRTLEAVSIGSPGFWLLMTVSFSAAMSYFMPRLFQGETFVFPVRAQNAGMMPLEPTTSNITQTIYFIADTSCFLIISGFAATSGGIRILLKVALFATTVNLVFAGVDLATYFTGTTELLSFIRNANYAMLVDDQAAGFKRIVGSFPEASSFGSATMGYFGFTLRLWLLGFYPRLSLILGLLSLLATLFATSTTAYVGLAVFLGLTYIELFIRIISHRSTFQMQLFVFCAPLVLSILVIAIALNDYSSAMARDLLDTFFFNKMATASGQERSSWNQGALQSFVDTFGFGFGNGSGRASSFLVATLASLGFIGSALFSMFFITLFFSGGRDGGLSPLEEAARQSAKSMCLAWLITSSVSDPLIELGVAFYAFAALAAARRSPRSQTEATPVMLQPLPQRLRTEPGRSASF